MELTPLGSTGIHVSRLGLGGLTFGRETAADEATTIIHAYLDAGGNLLDTADIYGKGRSEEIIGEALRGCRDEVVLMSKARFRMGPHPNQAGASRRHLLSALESSLRRLRTDHLDVWVLHAWDPFTAPWETLSTLDEVVRAGKVRYTGASIFTGWQLAHCLGLSLRHGLTPFAVVHPEYSLAVREAEREILPFCRAAGLACLPWSPLGGGVLSGAGAHSARAKARWNPETARLAEHLVALGARLGRTPAEIALNWLLRQQSVTAPILGTRTLAQLKENLRCLEWTLDDADLADLDSRSAIRLGYPHDVDGAGSEDTVLRTPWRE